ncbi:MAG: DNA-processing protein DprA [Clostridiales bacterium]|nr:DNA-processing protein DprA [Clostridiales bacterium]
MDEIKYWVWLSRVFAYGSEKPRILLEVFHSPRAVLEASEEDLKKLSFLKESDRRAIIHTSLERADKILSDCDRLGIHIICYGSPEYPHRLADIYAPPMVLYVKGEIQGIDEEAGITVVGTRRASDYGKRLTGNLCYELSRAGALIISGCAEGIDTYAHWGALKAGGRTIAVLGCGLDVDYPASNRELKLAILRKGALVSECPPGEYPTRSIFPVRNRLMSALGVGVLVTEAPMKSGSLITAEHAIEQGKDLFCVPPHDIYDVNFGGVARYLRDGAIPVFSAKDVLDEYFMLYPHKLNAEYQFAQQVKRNKTLPVYHQRQTAVKKEIEPQKVLEQKQKAWDPTLSKAHRNMFDAMTSQPESLDEIAARAGLSAAQAAAIATELELLEYISSYSGKRYAKHVITE